MPVQFSEAPDRTKRILLVEDNRGDVELLRIALARAGIDCQVTIVEDGSEALEFINRRGKYANVPVPDLAVLDLNVPKSDGREILEAMRANEVFADVPVAVLSSSSSPRDEASLAGFNIRRYIVKPIDLDEFLSIGTTLKEILSETNPRTRCSGA